MKLALDPYWSRALVSLKTQLVPSLRKNIDIIKTKILQSAERSEFQSEER